MKKLTLLSCLVAGLISTSAIAQTVGKAVGGVTGAAVGAGVGAGVGALKAPSKGLKSGMKCVNKTGLPVLCTTAGAIDTGASPVEGAAKGAAAGSGN
jgi:hypothetical protein